MKDISEKHSLRQLNLELTTFCPLRCPQCYCSFEDGMNLDYTIAQTRIQEAVELGLEQLNLSGGETLCYPHLFDLISFAHGLGVKTSVALSGAFFTQSVYEKLNTSGVDEICVSLNGSTEEINALTRDGYLLAIHALELLKTNKYHDTTLNWVMHCSNADDFVNIIRLAEYYEVKTIDIIGVKPDSKSQLDTLPTAEQMVNVSQIIKRYQGSVHLAIESCYSNMLALHLDTRLFGNLNVTPDKGCVAGRSSMSVNVHGECTPCRHIEYTDSYQGLKEYWENSAMLSILRSLESKKAEPCNSCGYGKYCRHCQAINWNLHHQCYIGFDACPIYKVK